MTVPATIYDGEKSVEITIMIDSGAGGNFNDQQEVKKLGLEQHKLEKKINAFNVDGTLNKKGTIKTYVNLAIKIGKRKRMEKLWVTGLGKTKLILGYPWLQNHNLEINWTNGTLRWDETKKTTIEEISDPDQYLKTINYLLENNGLFTLGLSTDLAIEQNVKKNNLDVKEIVPEDYHEYLDIFDEQKAN